MYLKQIVYFSCLTVSSFASLSSNTVSGQNYRKIDFPLQVWNLFSSDKTEEVTIVPDALNSGTIECGVACHINPDCGGFLFDKSSGSCSMKQVTEKLIILTYIFVQQFLCLLNLQTPSEDQDSVAIYVKTERFAPCLGHGTYFSANVYKIVFFFLQTHQISLDASQTPPAYTRKTHQKRFRKT